MVLAEVARSDPQTLRLQWTSALLSSPFPLSLSTVSGLPSSFHFEVLSTSLSLSHTHTHTHTQSPGKGFIYIWRGEKRVCNLTTMTTGLVQPWGGIGRRQGVFVCVVSASISSHNLPPAQPFPYPAWAGLRGD